MSKYAGLVERLLNSSLYDGDGVFSPGLTDEAHAAIEALEAENARLREVFPMEDAPKDGTTLEIWLEEFNTPSFAYWSDGVWMIPDDFTDMIGAPYAWRHMRPRPQRALDEIE